MNLGETPYLLGPMTLEDVPTIASIERAVFTMPWSANTFSCELRGNPQSEYLVLRYAPWVEGHQDAWPALARSLLRVFHVAKEDAAILGYGGLWMMLDEAHICTLAMREAWRGRGLGEAILAALIERARARGAETVTLEVRVSNVRAQGLYTKYGFVEVGRRKGYYTDNNEDAFIMTTPPIVAEAYRQRFRQLTQQLQERLAALPQLPPDAPLPATPSP